MAVPGESHATDSDALLSLMRTIVDGVITINQDGEIVDFNPACERLFGYSAAEVIGSNVKMLMPTPYTEQHDGYLENYRQTRQRKIIGIGHEVMGRRKDGTTFPMELSVGEIERGGPRAFVGVIRDVTQRSRLEQELRDSDALHRAIVETAVDGVIIIDQLGSVRIFNSACEKMFGYSAAEVVGRNVRMLMPSPFYDEHDRFLRNYQETKQRKIIGIGREVVGRRRDGRTFPMELSVGETVIDGQPIFVGVLRDITFKKASEDQLRRSQGMLQERVLELEVARDSLERQGQAMAQLAQQASSAREAADRANAAKSEFLAIVSHELRTPMNVMLGFAALLDEAQLPQPHGERAGMILQSGQALMTILNDILDLSRIEARRLELSEEAVSVSDLLLHVEKLWSGAAERKGLYLHIRQATCLPPTVLADPVRLRQILFNLVSNAVKFTRTGGVSVEVGEVERAHDRVVLRFEVADTGEGVPEHKRKAIFEPFTQGETGVGRRHTGAGLGLSIARHLVERMGGGINVDDQPGGGARFWFTVNCALPCTDEPAPHPGEQAGLSHAASLHVLLAEDHPLNQHMCRAILEAAGHDVQVVNDGGEAVEAAREGAFDVVLMDVSMPMVDGLEATRRIRQLPGPSGRLPVIALTANAMKGDRERFLAAGMSDYLSKPVEIRRLLETLQRHAVSAEPAVRPPLTP